MSLRQLPTCSIRSEIAFSSKPAPEPLQRCSQRGVGAIVKRSNLEHHSQKAFEAGAVGFARMFLGELFKLASVAGFFKREVFARDILGRGLADGLASSCSRLRQDALAGCFG